ncbi:MAG: hypothetical protein WBA12_16015, partial [Catalinimonas sp.]
MAKPSLLNKILLATPLLWATACPVPPTFDTAPRLTALEQVAWGDSGRDARERVIDTLIYRVAFQDGDGNLGHFPEDSLPSNFFGQIYVRRQGEYVPLLPTG